jgi:hypothetical protein
MQRKTRKIIGAVALIGALAAGGAAFTASSAIPATVAGYASASITGATANSVSYTFDTSSSASPSYGDIIAVNLVFNEDLTNGAPPADVKNDVIQSAFNGTLLTQNCAVTLAYDGTTIPIPGKGTHVTCDYSNPTVTGFTPITLPSPGVSSVPQLTSGATRFAVTISTPVSTP